MLLARAARTLAARTLAATTAAVLMAAGLTAVATPAAAQSWDPTDWRTLPYTDLVEKGGWKYVSMMDYRWKYDRMQTNDTPIWQCSCTPAALANLLDWEFPLDGFVETVPHAPTPLHSWWDQRGPHVDQELLWSPTYVDAFLAKTNGYQDRGIRPKACGVYAYPWSLTKAGAPKTVDIGGELISSPSGITWSVHDTRESGLTDEVRNVIARELDAGRLVVVMRAAPAGLDDQGRMKLGGHANIITGFNPQTKRLLAVDHGWPKGLGSSEGAARVKYDETYAEWEDSILEVWAYQTVSTVSRYSSLVSAPASGLRAAAAPADYRLSAVRPDGERIGYDPATGESRVVDGSYAHGGVLSDDPVSGGTGAVQHLPDAAFFREPGAGRWRYTVHGVTDGGYDLLLQDHVDGASVERGRLHGTVEAGGQRKVEAVRAADGTTTVTEVEQFSPEPVVDARATADTGASMAFDGSRSYDADGSVTSWSWDLGDGTVLDGEQVSHAFDAPGTYPVTLTVTDDAGATTTVAHEVVVSRSDVVAPRLALEPSGGGDWQRAPFDVTVSATDAGRGVRRLTARAEGASASPEQDSAGPDLVVPVTVEGRTTVVANAVDRDGNDTGEQRRIVGLDRTAPQSSVTTPLAGGEVAGLGMVAGPVLDATSGAASVEVSLVRESDGRAWDGTAWVDGERWLVANVGGAAPDRWFLADRLPSGTSLPTGSYVLRSRAVDRAGNAESAGTGTAFTVGDSALPQAEPVRLSEVGESTNVQAVDRDGTAVGVSHTRRRAVVWPADGGPRVELPPLPGHASSWADDVLGGVVVGTSTPVGAGGRAVVWRDGVPTDLGLLPGASSAAATGVTADGTAWGTNSFPDGRQVAVRFDDGGPVELPGLGGAVTFLTDVSADGRWAVGKAQDAAGAHLPVRWEDGVPSALPDLGGAWVAAVNTAGQAAGRGSTGSHSHAAAWSTDGTVHDLGPGEASAIDERGVVVGTSGNIGDTGNRLYAAAWQDGGLLRLDDVQPVGSAWRLVGASAISPVGGVVAGGGLDADGGGSFRLEVARLSADPDVDAAPPTVDATPEDGGWHREPVTLTVTASDPDSGVASVTTSATGEVAGDRAEVLVRDEGTTTVAYTATDAAGNVAPVRTATVRIDRTAPTVRLAAGPEGWSRTSVVLPVTASDELSGLATLHYRVDDGPEVVVSDPGAGVEVSADGVHTVTAWAVDRAGNASAPLQQQVRVDATAPVVEIGPAADGATVERSTVLGTVVADATSGLATSQVRHLVDGTDAGDGGPAVTVRRDGEHRIEVTATDAAGNTTSRTLTVTVDGEPGLPATPWDEAAPVAVAGGPYTTVVGRPVVLDGSASRGDDLVLRWRLPDSQDQVEGTTVPWTPPAAGTYLVELEASSGGRRSLPDVAVVEVTEQGSDVTADAGDDVSLVEGGTVTLAGSVSQGASAAWVLEPVGEVTGSCTLGAASAASTTLTCDDEGAWRAVLTAAEGGRTAQDELAVTVANADPTVTLDAPATVRPGDPVTVRATPADAGEGDVLTCVITWPGGARSEGCTATAVLPGVGPHQVRVDVTDGDGGSGSAVATVAVRFAVELADGGTVEAGQAVPVRFGLHGYHGMEVLRQTVSVRLDADGRPVGAEVAVTPGASELTYAPGDDRYQWVWKTSRSWAGQTRALVLRLADGSEHRVVHRFR